jgi:hypothetical protein
VQGLTAEGDRIDVPAGSLRWAWTDSDGVDGASELPLLQADTGADARQ